MQKIMTMEEVEAQLRRKSQQQQQQRPQGAPMTGTDLGMLGSMGPPMQPGLSVQLSASVPLQPEHMQHGPPGFPSPAGPPHRPPQYDSQHLGIFPLSSHGYLLMHYRSRPYGLSLPEGIQWC